MKNEIFDTRAWLAWVLGAATVTMVARNPLYSLILLACSQLVNRTCSRKGGDLQVPMVKMAAFILLFSGLFSGLFIHVGELTLVRLPRGLPLVGGPLTVEAFLSGIANGLLLLALLSLFVTFNRVVTGERLVRLAPRAFKDLGIVTLVALTYVPETARQVERIREAQAVRGHQVRGLRDWQPLVIPLLIGGLERAMSLSEAMVARGFGATERKPLSEGSIAWLALSIGLTFGGWIVALWWGTAGWLVMAAGVVILAASIWSAGRGVVVTRYRPRSWQTRDNVLVGLSLFPALVLIIAGGASGVFEFTSFSFSFLNGLAFPEFEAVVGTLLIAYVSPAILCLLNDSQRSEDPYDHD